MKKKIISISLFILFFAMLLTPDLTKSAALNGLNLWFFTVLPTLLPFMIVSGIIINTGAYNYISAIFRPVMEKIYRLPANAGYPLFIGLLCGLPMGAKVTSDMVSSKLLSKESGNILLSFCNNLSPAFITSFVIGHILNLSGKERLYASLTVLICPLITGLIFSRIISRNMAKNKQNNLPGHVVSYNMANTQVNLIDGCILSSFESIFKLGGYIMLFSILSSIATSFFPNPLSKSIISSLFEITSGLNTFAESYMGMRISHKGFIIIICLLTSFGGICGIAQTYSMIKKSGLKISAYFCGKLTTCLLTFTILSFLL